MDIGVKSEHWLVVGLGTGLAPSRALFQQREDIWKEQAG
jgi:sulfite reductase alpha subunit-like flavoprotein